MNIGIRVENLSKSFGANHALNRVGLNFDAGLMHGVIGPEGAGKTTLFRLLLGLLHPDSGSIHYLDSQKEIRFSEVRHSIAYMPQTQSLYADLSIDEHLEFFRALYQVPRAEFRTKRDELLEITRLAPFSDRPAGQLSGGMYKKLGLMCALLRSPKVMLLDEPTNGVDPISRREFWQLLYRLNEQKILILVATAYMDEAERCSRVHLLEAGIAIAEGEPRDLLSHEGVRTFDELFLRRSRDQETSLADRN